MTHTRIRGLLAVLFAVIFCAASFPARTVSAANEDGGYAITGYTIVDNGDGTVVLSEITARAESDQETQLYIAVYNEADRLVNLIEEDITMAGETVLEPELTYDKSDTVKVFWWKELIPLMDVYTLDNEHKDPAATASPAPTATATATASPTPAPTQTAIPVPEPTSTAPTVSGNEIYVAPDGSDESGDGSAGNPYGSFERARAAVAEINDNMTEDITVYFRGGTYYVDETIVLGVEDSGSNGYNVEYKAYPGEEPVFSGGERVTGWTQDTENPNLYVAELNRDERLRQLYVNDQRAYMPSKQIRGQGGYGEHTITAGEGDYAWTDLTQSDGVKFNPSDLPADVKNPSDIEVQTRSTWTTATVAIRGIESVDGSTVALFEQPYGAIAQSLGWGTAYSPSKENYVYNVFEFLDEPGEFYFDRAEQKLYYWPREGEDMATAEVYAPEVDTLLRIEGEDLESHASHIVIDGLTFENTDWNLAEIDGSHGKAAHQASLTTISSVGNWHHSLYRSVDLTPAAVEVTSADNIGFVNNTIKHTANDGLNVINDVTDSVFDGNVIYDTGGTALSVGHPQHHEIGDKGSEELLGYKDPSNQYSDKEKYDVDVEGLCSNLDITNNYMVDLAVTYYGCPGMTIYYGTELSVLHNHVENAPYSGISLGWGWGYTVGADISDTNGSTDPQGETPNLQNNEVAYNRVINVLTTMADGGSIYTLGPMKGTTIHDNYLSKVGKNGYHSRGIHIDEGTRYMEAYNNVIEVDTDQAGIDCGTWGTASNIYHPKGYNTIYNNYLTTALYKTTTAYETGTVISDRHTNLSGFWKELEPISVIRNSGVGDEYLGRALGDPEDLILPTNYSLSEDTGITEINVPETIDGEIWLAPEGTADFTESDTVKKASGGKLQIPTVIGDYYIYVIKDGEVSGPSKGCITTEYVSSDETPARTDVIGPYWADQEAENHVDNYQGSNGDVSDEKFGAPLNVGETSAVFGILNSDEELAYSRINGVDSSGSGWIGYVEKTVNLERAGEYEMYILCFGDAGRSYNVYVGGELKAQTKGIIGITDASSEKAYSSDNCLNILQVNLQLEAGDNTIRIQGNGAGPNFVAFALVKVEQEISTDGMQLWLRADKGVDTDGDGYVTGWTDMSGMGHNAASIDTESAPVYSSAAANGEPAIVFDGENDLLRFPFEGILAGKSDVTVIIVSAADENNDPVENVNGDQDPLLYFDETSEGWGKFVVTPFMDQLSIRLAGRGNNYAVDKNAEDIHDGFSTTAIVKEGTNIQVYDKGSGSVDTLTGVPNAIDRISDEYGYLGGFGENTGYFSGAIAEIIIYDDAVDLGVVQSVNTYLNNKYYKEEVELTGGLDIFEGEQDEGTTTPGAAATNTYIKNVFGQGGWQAGGVYQFGVSDDYRAAFDGDTSTYYDGPKSGYCGVEFDQPQVITKIGYQS